MSNTLKKSYPLILKATLITLIVLILPIASEIIYKAGTIVGTAIRTICI